MTLLRNGFLDGSKPKGTTPTVLIPGDGTTIWNLTGNVTAGLGYIQSGSSQGWNKGGSFIGIGSSQDFSLEFTFSSTVGVLSDTTGIIGISETDSSGSYTDIMYGWQFNSYNSYCDLRVYETNGQQGTIFGAASIDDVFKIERVSGTVRYYWNGSLIYTSLVTSSNPLIFDSAIYRKLKAYDITLTLN